MTDKKTMLISRQDFITKVLKGLGLLSLAQALNFCKEPNENDEPGGGGGGGGGGGNPTIDPRAIADLERQIEVYILNVLPTKKHTTFAAAHTDVSKFIEDLILDKKYDIGNFSHFEYGIVKMGQFVDYTNVDIKKVTKNTACKLRSVSKRLDHSDENLRANIGYHTISCDDK